MTTLKLHTDDEGFRAACLVLKDCGWLQVEEFSDIANHAISFGDADHAEQAQVILKRYKINCTITGEGLIEV